MESRWSRLKGKAIDMRRSGRSLRHIEIALKIPRSTLSGWLKTIKLTERQRRVLLNNWKRGLANSRVAAVAWHNEQKLNRLKQAESEAQNVLENIDCQDPSTLELALAILYLGEGFKNDTTGMGNSDPLILKFFINVLTKNFKIPVDKFRCELHVRADQNPTRIRRWWSQELGIPLKNFLSVSVDKRTAGTVTYPSYKGVCVVRCGSVAVQRKLMYLSKIFCQKTIDQCARSSIG